MLPLHTSLYCPSVAPSFVPSLLSRQSSHPSKKHYPSWYLPYQPSSIHAGRPPARLIVGCLYQMYWVHTIHYYILHIWGRGCLVLGKRLCTHVARFDNEYSKLARKDTHLLHVGCINLAGVKDMEYICHG